MRTSRSSLLLLLGSALLVLVGTACSGSVELGSVGSRGISGPGLEEDIAERVTELSDVAPESVDCPEGIDAEVGATTSCEMVLEGVSARITIEATSVSEDEERMDFSWQVEPGTQRLLTAQVRDIIAEAFFEETGLVLSDLTCPEPELEGTAGAVMTCAASTVTGESGPVVLTVTGSEGMGVDFRWGLGDDTPS